MDGQPTTTPPRTRSSSRRDPSASDSSGTEADDAVNFGAVAQSSATAAKRPGLLLRRGGSLSNWWTDEDRCVQERSSSSTAPHPTIWVGRGSERAPNATLPTSTALTIGGTSRDLGGLTIAWKAWAMHLARRARPHRPRHRRHCRPSFFSWARAWRTTRAPIPRQMLAIHSPAWFRCNQVLRNLDTFARRSSPQRQDVTEPSQRVTIW